MSEQLFRNVRNVPYNSARRREAFGISCVSSYLIFSRFDSFISMLRVAPCGTRVPLETCISPLIDCSRRCTAPRIFHRPLASTTVKYRLGFRGKQGISHGAKSLRAFYRARRGERVTEGASSRHRAHEVDVSTPRSTKVTATSR